jgi:L-fucose isomerase-like protein
LRENPLAAPLIFPERNFLSAGETLMPGGESVVICETHPDVTARAASTINEILSSKSTLYADGQIRYKDVFGHDRFTNIRKIASGERITTDSPFTNAADGNDSN